jgi:hypothetical protein
MSELADMMFKASAALASVAQNLELQTFTTKVKPEVSMRYLNAELPGPVVDVSEALKFEDSFRLDNALPPLVSTEELIGFYVGQGIAKEADMTKLPSGKAKETQERALKLLSGISCSSFTDLKFIVTITGTTCLMFAKWKGICSNSELTNPLTSRKYYVSPHMTDEEITQTGFLCLKTALEHELRETFKVNGKAIFGPHLSHDQLKNIETKERA